jgi:hypothetical protein
VALVARAPLVVTRPAAPTADPTDDALFAARSALKRAYAMRSTADLQIEQLRALIAKLEGRQ